MVVRGKSLFGPLPLSVAELTLEPCKLAVGLLPARHKARVAAQTTLTGTGMPSADNLLSYVD